LYLALLGGGSVANYSSYIDGEWIYQDGVKLPVAYSGGRSSYFLGGGLSLNTVLLMLNLPFLRQAYKVYQETAFCVRQYSCLLINAVCNFSLRSASRPAIRPAVKNIIRR